jgi:hypothetical protein
MRCGLHLDRLVRLKLILIAQDVRGAAELDVMPGDGFRNVESEFEESRP